MSARDDMYNKTYAELKAAGHDMALLYKNLEADYNEISSARERSLNELKGLLFTIQGGSITALLTFFGLQKIHLPVETVALILGILFLSVLCFFVYTGYMYLASHSLHERYVEKWNGFTWANNKLGEVKAERTFPQNQINDLNLLFLLSYNLTIAAFTTWASASNCEIISFSIVILFLVSLWIFDRFLKT